MIVRELIKSDFLFQQIDVGTYTYSFTCNQNQVPARGETSPSDVLPALLLLFQYGLARSGGASEEAHLPVCHCHQWQGPRYLWRRTEGLQVEQI